MNPLPIQVSSVSDMQNSMPNPSILSLKIPVPRPATGRRTLTQFQFHCQSRISDRPSNFMILFSAFFSCPFVEPCNTPEYFVANIIAALEIGNLLRGYKNGVCAYILRLGFTPYIILGGDQASTSFCSIVNAFVAISFIGFNVHSQTVNRTASVPFKVIAGTVRNSTCPGDIDMRNESRGPPI